MTATVTLQSGTALQIDDLVAAAYDALADGELTFGEMIQLGGLLAGKVNRFVQLSGPEKLKVVLAAVEKALERVLAEKVKSLPEADRAAFEEKVKAAGSFAKDALPAAIALAVDAANGKLGLGHVKKTCLQGLLLALRCASQKMPELPLVKDVAKAVEAKLEEESKEEKADTAPEKIAVEVPAVLEVKTTEEAPEPSKALEESQKEVPSETQSEPQKE
jgi:hypothetical protein